jgi:CYTH domain-containing protein
VDTEFAELERRFLVEDLTVLEGHLPELIAQGYLLNKDGWAVRVRRTFARDTPTGPTYEAPASLTVKGPRSGVGRFEVQYDIPPEAAAELFKRAPYKVFKSRRQIIDAGTTWDVDSFHRDNEGLVIAECEMADPKLLSEVVPPAWCGREVTGDTDYNNEELARVPHPLWPFRLLIERLDAR